MSWLNSQPLPSYLQNPWMTMLRQVRLLLLLVSDTAKSDRVTNKKKQQHKVRLWTKQKKIFERQHGV